MTAVCLTIIKIEGLMSYNAPVTLGLGTPTGEKWGQTGGQSRTAAARAMVIRITSRRFTARCSGAGAVVRQSGWQAVLPHSEMLLSRLIVASRTRDQRYNVLCGPPAQAGAEFWINPEIDQGFGLNNTLGVAGFTSGEAYKVGQDYPYARVPRAFIRQTINLGGDVQKIDAGINQLAGTQTSDRLVVTIGNSGSPISSIRTGMCMTRPATS
jgi:hypothetical protein